MEASGSAQPCLNVPIGDGTINRPAPSMSQSRRFGSRGSYDCSQDRATGPLHAYRSAGGRRSRASSQASRNTLSVDANTPVCTRRGIMRSRAAAVASLLVLALATTIVAPVPAHARKLQWSKSMPNCEPPNVFYSANHRAGALPCCPAVEGVCAGGLACPANGVCAGDGKACAAAPIVPRPNVVLFISDDQGYCDYGTAGECRSVQSGTPIPPPSTPNLDLLAGYGTIFPIAHNTASWCFPSLATIITGRYQKSFGRKGKVGEKFVTIPRVLHTLGDDPSAPIDPYNPRNRVGGYCTFLGGKFTASTGDAGFDALARGRKLGRTDCVAGHPRNPPRCGSQTKPSFSSPAPIVSMEDLFGFLESLFLRVPGVTPAAYTMQHFFAWVAPRVPPQPLTAPGAIQNYLF